MDMIPLSLHALFVYNIKYIYFGSLDKHHSYKYEYTKKLFFFEILFINL